jgi:hypothetical protein
VTLILVQGTAPQRCGPDVIDNGDTYRHRLMIVSENDDGHH